SRMASCGGSSKSKVTVSKRVWDFLTKESPARLAQLQQDAQVSILVDGETSDIYVLQLLSAHPVPAAGLCPARKALKALLKETEKELKKKASGAQRHGGDLLGSLPGALLQPAATGAPPGGHSRAGGAAAGTAGNTGTAGRAGSTGTAGRAGTAGSTGTAGTSWDEEPERQCPICLGEIQKAKTLEKCQHSFCEACITRALQVKRACPMCGRFYGQLVGNQPPNGRMLVSRDASLLLPGYEKFGTIIIQYVFPPGVQGVEHPNPGVRYPGTTRVAYLPDCPEGNKV
ncbi:DTX3 ligase, partial [Semnornis frantzii]|nr:DTX3 ligase [Semnornis frantzii]